MREFVGDFGDWINAGLGGNAVGWWVAPDHLAEFVLRTVAVLAHVFRQNTEIGVSVRMIRFIGSPRGASARNHRQCLAVEHARDDVDAADKGLDEDAHVRGAAHDGGRDLRRGAAAPHATQGPRFQVFDHHEQGHRCGRRGPGNDLVGDEAHLARRAEVALRSALSTQTAFCTTSKKMSVCEGPRAVLGRNHLRRMGRSS